MNQGETPAVRAMQADFGKLLKPYEAAAILGIRPKLLAQHARDGKITFFRLTELGHRRYPEQAVRALLAARNGGAR